MVFISFKDLMNKSKEELDELDKQDNKKKKKKEEFRIIDNAPEVTTTKELLKKVKK